MTTRGEDMTTPDSQKPAPSSAEPPQGDTLKIGGTTYRILDFDANSPLKKALLTGFHSTAKHNATKAVSPSSETMRTI